MNKSLHLSLWWREFRHPLWLLGTAGMVVDGIFVLENTRLLGLGVATGTCFVFLAAHVWLWFAVAQHHERLEREKVVEALAKAPYEPSAAWRQSLAGVQPGDRVFYTAARPKDCPGPYGTVISVNIQYEVVQVRWDGMCECESNFHGPANCKLVR